MGWIIAIIVGGVAGWLASMVMSRDASMGIFRNIVVGVIGAVHRHVASAADRCRRQLADFRPRRSHRSAFVGAVVLLAIVNLVQRGRVR